ncbi:hypothetical protein MAR_010112 [Mya arenaria]|uniref:Uncharacterized protein n=1 Tax=Mya arenaria TaxID=6604 RepID=A0ABY7E2X7_MYAAR|nr:hypothetical protein MAR_010112 [Mya arenaria]
MPDFFCLLLHFRLPYQKAIFCRPPSPFMVSISVPGICGNSTRNFPNVESACYLYTSYYSKKAFCTYNGVAPGYPKRSKLPLCPTFRQIIKYAESWSTCPGTHARTAFNDSENMRDRLRCEQKAKYHSESQVFLPTMRQKCASKTEGSMCAYT